jgi:hypothetical protein
MAAVKQAREEEGSAFGGAKQAYAPLVRFPDSPGPFPRLEVHDCLPAARNKLPVEDTASDVGASHPLTRSCGGRQLLGTRILDLIALEAGERSSRPRSFNVKIAIDTAQIGVEGEMPTPTPTHQHKDMARSA